MKYLSRCDEPVSGTALAREFGVSRQVIVQDIALLRSAKKEILSTNRGYLIEREKRETAVRIFKCCHTDEQTEDELNCIVDQGGVIEDVFVNHKLYGRIRAAMDIRSRRDVRDYLAGIYSGKSKMLKKVTSDYHYHTVMAESEGVLDIIEDELRKRDYLVQPKKI